MRADGKASNQCGSHVPFAMNSAVFPCTLASPGTLFAGPFDNTHIQVDLFNTRFVLIIYLDLMGPMVL